MSRNDKIWVVGCITAPIRIVIDASKWQQRVYETELTRKRPSGTEDTYILRFAGGAAGSESNAIEKITEGVEVLIGGEIRTENVNDPKPEDNLTRVYIYAEIVMINEPPVKDQNEVRLRGRICKKPRFRKTHKRTSKGKNVAATSMILAVTTPSGTYYVPVVCWNWIAYGARTLDVGDFVEIYGRFQSRDFKKQIEGRETPYLCTTHEVSVIELKSSGRGEKKEGEENRKNDAENNNNYISDAGR